MNARKPIDEFFAPDTVKQNNAKHLPVSVTPGTCHRCKEQRKLTFFDGGLHCIPCVEEIDAIYDSHGMLERHRPSK